MASLISFIPPAIIDRIKKNLGVSTVVALQQLDKVVTAKTAQSVRVEETLTNEFIDFSVIAGGGMRYIIDGKPAGTKYPMKKVGDEWQLVQELEDWKNVVNFDGPDFLLAREIAENEREPVDVSAKTLEVYEQLFGPTNSQGILKLFSFNFGKEIVKMSE